MTTVASTKTFEPSPYQKAIFRFVQEEEGSAIIQAVAGSGKSTTIINAVALVPAGQSVLFVAFNKSIVEELEGKIEDRPMLAIKTFHSLGASMLWNLFFKTDMRKGSKPVLDTAKTDRIFREYCLRMHIEPEESAPYKTFVKKMVSLAKETGLGYFNKGTDRDWFDLMEQYGIDCEENEYQGLEYCRAVLHESCLECTQGDVRKYDFSDMLYQPLVNNIWPGKAKRFDVIFVDEAQDTNLVQQALLKRLLNRGGRVIAVGDRAQAIYGFRGADSNAMDRLATDFECVELPLTVSYRCPQAVVKLAQSYVPHIEAHDGAPMGSVRYDINLHEVEWQEGDAILCRNSAPLVSMAFSLLKRRVPIEIIGREVASEMLLTFLNKLKARDIPTLQERLVSWKERELQAAIEAEKDSLAQQIEDKAEIMQIFIDELPENDRTVSRLKKDIKSLFDQAGSVKLATVHKSKGLEWDRVFILDFDQYMPSPWARQQWELKQEDNLIYVAFTRAKKTLIFLSSRKEKK